MLLTANTHYDFHQFEFTDQNDCFKALRYLLAEYRQHLATNISDGGARAHQPDTTISRTLVFFGTDGEEPR